MNGFSLNDAHMNALGIDIFANGMFPSNLHKNLLQLDREISVLEIESQNMEMDKTKVKPTALQKRTRQNDKLMDMHQKIVSVKSAIKKNAENPKRLKKSSPATSSRVHSTASVPSNCSKKQSNKIHEISNITKSCKTIDSCSCPIMPTKSTSCNNIKHNKVSKCDCEHDLQTKESKPKLKSSYLNNIGSDSKKDCVIHKEVLFSNPDGSIEVTVKQKSNMKNPAKSALNFDMAVKSAPKTETCYCQHVNSSRKQNSEPKWSEILSLGCAKSREDEVDISSGVHNRNFNKAVPKGITDLKHLNCENCLGTLKFNHLGEEKQKKLFDALSAAANKICCEGTDKSNDFIKYDCCIDLKGQNEVLQTIQRLCDNLISEKELLTRYVLMPNECCVPNLHRRYIDYLHVKLIREVTAKNSIIENMKKREAEYDSLLSMMEMNLNKAKDNSRANVDMVNELKNSKLKILELTQALDEVRKRKFQLKEALDKCILENDRLKTEVQIYKLERQKHDVLMAAKEVEIERYREEIGNFKKRISEHLACLKSNSQVADMKKIMEAIIQQSQFFINDDSSAIALDGISRDEQPNKLMHSSPTSTKTSDVNSSWKQISSIRTQDPKIHLNVSEEKEFYQVYGGDLSISSKNLVKKTSATGLSSDDLRETPIVFTSCLSESSRNSPKKLETVIDQKINFENIVKSSKEKLRYDIDELLSGMKLKLFEKVKLSPTSDNGTIDDFLNGSVVSTIYE